MEIIAHPMVARLLVGTIIFGAILIGAELQQRAWRREEAERDAQRRNQYR